MWKFTPPLGALPHPLFLHQGVLSFRVAKNQVIDLKKSQSVLCSPRGVLIVVDTYDTISVVVENSVRFWFDFQRGLACAFTWYWTTLNNFEK